MTRSADPKTVDRAPTPGRRALLHQDRWLSPTAFGAALYGLLMWVVGTFVFSAWPLDGSRDVSPIAELAGMFTVINALWGLALVVDLMNALASRSRGRLTWVVGTVFALGLVGMAQLAISELGVAVGG